MCYQISEGARSLIKKLSLKTRKFIGNTTMDPQLALLMANQAMVCPGDVVLDPFVGSGSLLVSAAQFGGFVVGADIDFLMLHAKNKPSRIKQKVSWDAVLRKWLTVRVLDEGEGGKC